MKALDFNALTQPTWTIKLKGSDTPVHLVSPSLQLIERLQAAAPEIQNVIKSKDAQGIRATFELVAELMSSNDEGRVFAAEELRDTYKMNLVDVVVFVAGYLEFIEEIKNAKN